MASSALRIAASAPAVLLLLVSLQVVAGATWEDVTNPGEIPGRYGNAFFAVGPSAAVSFGGCTERPICGCFNDVWIFTADDNDWQGPAIIQNGPSPRAAMQATLADGFLYVAGGMNPCNEQQFQDVWVLGPIGEDGDTSKSVWTRLPDLLATRWSGWMATLIPDGSVGGTDSMWLVISGGNIGDDSSTNMEILPASGNDIWQPLSYDGDAPFPTAGMVSALLSNSTVLVLEGNMTSFAEFRLTSSSSGSWKAVDMSEPLPPRQNAGGALVGGTTFYVFGGTYNSSLYNDVWQADLDKNQWSQVVANGSEPCPPARNLASLVVLQDQSEATFLYMAFGSGQSSRGLADTWRLQISN